MQFALMCPVVVIPNFFEAILVVDIVIEFFGKWIFLSLGRSNTCCKENVSIILTFWCTEIVFCKNVCESVMLMSLDYHNP